MGDQEKLSQNLVGEQGSSPNLDLGLGFSGFIRSLWFVILQDVPGGNNKRFFEVAINLAQFPEDQNKENRDHEQQELDIHLLAL